MQSVQSGRCEQRVELVGSGKLMEEVWGETQAPRLQGSERVPNGKFSGDSSTTNQGITIKCHSSSSFHWNQFYSPDVLMLDRTIDSDGYFSSKMYRSD